jgi:ubiquinone/menaquinone biosynthesis C-methylase UbiE
MSYRFTHYLLGTEGLALMRSWYRAEAGGTPDQRVAEIRQICEEYAKDQDADLLSVDELATQDGYQRWAATYDSQDNPFVFDEPVLRDLFAPLAPGRALDAACGTGRQSLTLRAFGHEVTGVDLTPEMLAQARKRVPDADFRQGALTALPVDDADFDLVVCTLALTHLPDLAAPIRELARALRPGGHMVLADLHPVQVALGGHASFEAKPGEITVMRNHVHLHESYVSSFTHSGLRIRDCIEPVYTEETAELLWTYRRAPDATRIAFIGMPAMLIWHLTKEPA